MAADEVLGRDDGRRGAVTRGTALELRERAENFRGVQDLFEGVFVPKLGVSGNEIGLTYLYFKLHKMYLKLHCLYRVSHFTLELQNFIILFFYGIMYITLYVSVHIIVIEVYRVF